MKTIKLTYAIEIEVPADELVVNTAAFVEALRSYVDGAPEGWAARMSRSPGVESRGEDRDP